MANFFRLTVALLLFAFSGSSFAAVPSVAQYKGTYGTCPVTSSASEALSCGNSGPNDAWAYSGCYVTSETETTISGQCQFYLGYPVGRSAQKLAPSCPVNSVLSAGSCVCSVGFVEEAGSCVVPPVDHAAEAKAVADGLNLAKSPLCFSGAPALQTCFAGYVINGGFAGTAAPDANGPRSCIFPNFTADGTTCNPLPDAAASPSTCQGGKVPGTVNGIDVCVEPGKTVAPGSTSSSGSETTNPDSTKTPGDAAQSSGQTSCTGTSCTTTTTTTTTKPDGSVTVTTNDKTEPKDSFCESNPASPLCAKSSFSASCGGPASCTGDAIQCAIAQEQHKRGCRLFDDVSPESQLYEAGKGKEGNQTGSLPGNDLIGIAGRINTSDALGGGSAGVADLHVTVWGQSITLPFSTVNPYLAALGNVLLAVSFLLALRIVARG